MARTEFRRAVETRDGSVLAVAPRLEAHAAKLEQLPAERRVIDAEGAARALRNAQQLYALDGLVLGGDGRLIEREAVPFALDVLDRLRRVLADRCALSLALPTPALLRCQLGLEADDAENRLVEIVTEVGRAEPDGLLLVGPLPDPSAIDAPARLAEHFGIALVPIGDDDEDNDLSGIVRLRDHAGQPPAPPPGTWLVTTRGEVPADTDPALFRAVLASLREQTPAAA